MIHDLRKRFVLALSCALLSCVAYALKDSFKPASDQHIIIAVAIMAFIAIPPFIAVGALVGNALMGALFGGICFLTYMGWCLYMISLYGI